MRKVIIKTWKDTTTKKFWNFFGGSISSLIAILLIGKNFFSLSLNSSIWWGLGSLLLLYIFRFILFFSQNAYKHWYYLYKESIYGDAIIFLKDAFSRIHWLRKVENITDEQFKTVMVFMCEKLKEIYDRKTKSVCSVSIKVPIEASVSANTEVKNLCRNNDALDRDTEKYRDSKHYIFGNTCYNSILTNITKNKRAKLFYINNDIEGSVDYENTSKDCYKDEKLPYKSELVVPILPLHNDEEKVYSILGFLCIDSNEKNVFDTKYDLAILQGVADGIYDIILFRNKPKQT